MPSKLPEAVPIDRPDDWTDRIDEPEPYEVDRDEMDLDESVTDEGDNSYMETPHQRSSKIRQGIRAAERFVETRDEQDLLKARRLLRRLF